jgi:MYXO-CTERM domain-containing protein
VGVARLTDDDRLAQQKLSPEGAPLASAQAKAPPGTVNVLARAAGSELYLVVSYNGGRQLGQLDASGFRILSSASASIHGPVQGAGAEAYLALDGALSRMQAGTVSQLAEASSTPVSGLGCYEQQCYACTRDGIAPLTAAGLGSLTFELSSLVPPALAGLPQGTADMCDLQWQHFRFDLLGLGVELREPAAAGSGTASLPIAGNGAAAGNPSLPQATAPAAKSGGCNLTQGTRSGSPGWALSGLALLWRWRTRRRRPHAAPPSHAQGSGRGLWQSLARCRERKGQSQGSG